MEPEPLIMFLRRARRICERVTVFTEFVEEDDEKSSSGKPTLPPRVEVQHLILVPLSQAP